MYGGAGETVCESRCPREVLECGVSTGGGEHSVRVAATRHLAGVDGQTGFDTVQVNTDNFGFALVEFFNSQHLKLFMIGQGGTAFVSPGGTRLLYTKDLSIATSGFAGNLDLYDNDMIVDYSPGLDTAHDDPGVRF